MGGGVVVEKIVQFLLRAEILSSITLIIEQIFKKWSVQRAYTGVYRSTINSPVQIAFPSS
jgi:hypothetical protein